MGPVEHTRFCRYAEDDTEFHINLAVLGPFER
jgi:hypothetical protein